jgi:hypothetical protein
MSRPIKQRESYDRDASKLLQLAQAIEMDAKASMEWRRETRNTLYKLTDLLTAESRKRAVLPSSQTKKPGVSKPH